MMAKLYICDICGQPGKYANTYEYSKSIYKDTWDESNEPVTIMYQSALFISNLKETKSDEDPDYVLCEFCESGLKQVVDNFVRQRLDQVLDLKSEIRKLTPKKRRHKCKKKTSEPKLSKKQKLSTESLSKLKNTFPF